VWRRVLEDELVKASLEHRFEGVGGEGSAVVEEVGTGGIEGSAGVSPGEVEEADFLVQGGGGGRHSADEAESWGADGGVGVEQDGDSVMVAREHWGLALGEEIVSLEI